MRHVLAVLTVAVSLTAAWMASAQEKQGKQAKPPEKIVFMAKNGDVTFQHQKHIERANGKCDTCHTKLFPQSREPINFKANLHKTAEANKSACAGCHVQGGAAFATAGNCNKCHVKQ